MKQNKYESSQDEPSLWIFGISQPVHPTPSQKNWGLFRSKVRADEDSEEQSPQITGARSHDDSETRAQPVPLGGVLSFA